jgi:hypothetical protein
LVEVEAESQSGLTMIRPIEGARAGARWPKHLDVVEQVPAEVEAGPYGGSLSPKPIITRYIWAMLMEFAGNSQPDSLDAMRECRAKKGETHTSHGAKAPLEAKTMSVVN